MRLRKVIFYGLWLFICCAVALVLVEAALRIWERRALSAKELLAGDPIDLGALGLNDTSISPKKEPDEFRVLGFGDSFAYAIVKPDFTYGGVAASMMTRNFGGRTRVRVVNFGEGGTSTLDYVATHAFWAPRLQHDAMLFNVYLGNDVTDVVYHPPAHAYHLQSGLKKSRVPRRFPLRTLDYARAIVVTRLRTEKDPKAIADPRFTRAGHHNLTEDVFLESNRRVAETYDPSMLQELEQGYRAIAALFRRVSEQRRRGIRTLVVLSPSQFQMEPALRERLAAKYSLDLSRHDLTLPARVILAIRDRVDPQIELVDLSPCFLCRAQRGEPMYYMTNTHWGIEGNALAGRVIAGRMASAWFGHLPSALDPKCETEENVAQAEIERFADRVATLAP